jgi:hypothetical protein
LLLSLRIAVGLVYLLAWLTAFSIPKNFPKNKKESAMCEELMQAMTVLREELLSHGDVYYGFLSSIESALTEYGIITNVHEVAESVLDRIIG